MPQRSGKGTEPMNDGMPENSDATQLGSAARGTSGHGTEPVRRRRLDPWEQPESDGSWLGPRTDADDVRRRLDASIAGLTEAQREAVEFGNGPLLIVAGPGSGKTRVMTHRIAKLIERGVPSWQIVALTFTNKAAEELRERIARLVPGTEVWAGTFHRFCAKLLRRYAPQVGLQENFTIYDRDDSLRALKEAIGESEVELFQYTAGELQNEIGRAKNRSLDPEAFLTADGGALASIAARVLPVYRRRLLAQNAVDFDDLLLHVARLMDENEELRRALDARFRHLLVDEYQDTNVIQYQIVRRLARDVPNLVVTGDPDQSIYGWRGADLRNIMDFERDYPTARVIRLERNYRSTKRILRVADQLIANNRFRRHKELFTENDEGEPVRLIHFPDHKDEAEMIAESIARRIAEGERRPSDFAIFYRINSLSRSFEMALRRRGVPYQVVQGYEFYQRKEVKDVLAYLTLLANPADDLAFERVVNVPPRGIGKTTLEKLKRKTRAARISMLSGALDASNGTGISARPAKQLQSFAQMIRQLANQASGGVEEILGRVLLESGYRESLERQESTESQERLANIDELLNAAREFDASSPVDESGAVLGDLEGFLEQAALVADTDAFEGSTDKVTLMTLHAAKGLEFPVVHIVALEHNLLPHARCKDDPMQLEEERRLLFVGITRAEQELQLSLAHYRAMRGSVFPTSPSSFLMELPRDEMECRDLGVDGLFRLGGPSGGRDRQAEFLGGDPFSFDPAALEAIDAYDGIDEPAEAGSEPVADNGLSRTAVGRRSGAEEFELVPDDEAFASDKASSIGKGRPTREATRTIRFDDSDDTAANAGSERRGAGLPLMTAARMAGEETSSGKIDPERFRHGQLVMHPEYGTGTIVGLSGSGVKRTGTVKFVGHGEKRFRLAFAPLVPIGG
ncbi:MAG TPA: UvrD-helicase domain-containing protein [Pirellulaceae bacterium]|nr:UvrD-helicase domain-containing protein [Pirellulaceae bacterium]